MRRLLGAAAVLVLTSVSPTNADDVAPRDRILLPELSAVSDDVIAWRTLDIADFRAEHPPASLWNHSGRLNAVSCVFIGTDEEIPLVVEREELDTRPARFRVRVASVEIVSLFDRGCSWWNAEIPVDRIAYTLEHEQIHFALAELAARRLQRVITERRASLEASAATAERARDRVQMQLDIALRKISDELHEEHERFDAETSIRYDPIAQDRWRVATENRLGASAAIPR
jgi:hypothetical protein